MSTVVLIVAGYIVGGATIGIPWFARGMVIRNLRSAAAGLHDRASEPALPKSGVS